MNGKILKYLLLIFTILFNVYAFYKHIPTEPLLKMHMTLAITILVIIFILRNNLINLLLLWFFFVLFQYAGVSFRLPMLPDIFIYRMVLILVFLIFIFEVFIAKKRRMLAFSGMEIAMIAFSMCIIFSMLFAGNLLSGEKGLTIGPFIVAYGIPFFIFFISKNIINDEENIKKFLIFLSIVGLYLGITGIFEYFDFRQLVFPKYIMAGEHGFRARGPFRQPAANGTVIVMIILTTFLLLLKESRKWKKWFYFFSLVCLNAALVFTFVRSGWIAYLFAILIIPIFIPRFRKAFVVSFLVLFIVFILVMNFAAIKIKTYDVEADLYKSGGNHYTLIDKIYHRTMTKSSVTGRKELYTIGFKMFLARPFLGHGYDAFYQSKKAFSNDLFLLNKESDAQRFRIHDTLFSLLIDTGLVGVSIYLFMIFYIFNVCRKLYNKLPWDRFLGKDLIVICAVALIIYLVSAQMFDIRFFLFPNGLFFCIAGIMVGLYQRMLQDEKANPKHVAFP